MMTQHKVKPYKLLDEEKLKDFAKNLPGKPKVPENTLEDLVIHLFQDVPYDELSTKEKAVVNKLLSMDLVYIEQNFISRKKK